MSSRSEKTFECPTCHATKPLSEGRPMEMVSGPVGEEIRKEHADLGAGQFICQTCLRKYRNEYIERAIESQRGELSSVEQVVLESMAEQEVLSRNINQKFDKELTMGQRLADRVAAFGGSWRFIILFGSLLLAWIFVNTAILLYKPFDPYPFILLNLVLSCLAAFQAPVIMMSQNRQEAKDRMHAEHDYQVNLKAEIEIRQLHIKMDQLMSHSWQKRLEIQRIQVEVMEDFISGKQKK